MSKKSKNVDEKECPKRPSITKTLQKYYNFVTIKRKYCESDADVVELKRTCGFRDNCFGVVKQRCENLNSACSRKNIHIGL